jgi:glycosyltransferase involved in cell wall biosynthesis
MTTLTVCIPAYNAEADVERAIRSVRVGEVPGGVEILVCDDGSTDGTWELLERLAGDIPEIRLLRNDENLGRPRTRNVLLENARGRFLTWLDADDEKYSGMLSAQLAHLDDIEANLGRDGLDGVLVFTNYHWLRAGWDEPKLIAPGAPVDPMNSLLDSSFGGYLWLMMGLRSTFLAAAPFDEDLPRLQDLGFFIRFAELGGRFEHVEDESALCVYHKEDRGRGALLVWGSWNRIWRHYRHHYVSYGMAHARRWRRHHYRVARRYAKQDGDKVAYAWILALEIQYVIWGRLRRLVFDA